MLKFLGLDLLGRMIEHVLDESNNGGTKRTKNGIDRPRFRLRCVAQSRVSEVRDILIEPGAVVGREGNTCSLKSEIGTQNIIAKATRGLEKVQ